MGLTFKENCPDLRNTKVADLVVELQSFGLSVDVHDPWIDASEAEHEYGIKPITNPGVATYDGVILAVAHSAFLDMGIEKIRAYGKPVHAFYDLKSVFALAESDVRL
jgi:UDP-N-acetyl-D-galactosamine dehydrogenase